MKGTHHAGTSIVTLPPAEVAELPGLLLPMQSGLACIFHSLGSRDRSRLSLEWVAGSNL